VRAPLALAVLVLVLVAGCGSSGTTAPKPRTPGTAASAASPSDPAAPKRLVVRTMSWRLPTPLAREAVVSVHGRIVVAGGLVTGDESTAVAYRIDPGTGRVQPLRSMPVPVHDTAGVLLGNRPVVVGGGNATEQDVVQVRRPGGWSVAGRIPQARSDLTAVTIGDRALVLGGYDARTPAVPSILSSRDGVHWSTIGALQVPVRYAAGVVSGGAVWAFGGERAGVEQRVVQRIDPATGRASVVAHLPHPLGHASAIALGRRILLVGGRVDANTPTDRMWWFDPTSHRFAHAGRLPMPLADSAVAVDGTEVYLVGGESPSVSDRVLRVALR
jgi:hypothetical protein